MPLIGTTGAASARGFGFFTTPISAGNWIAYSTTVGAGSASTMSPTRDAAGAYYFAGPQSVKLSSNGTRIYSRSFSSQSVQQCVASSGGELFFGSSNSGSVPLAQIGAFNSSGTALSWTRSIGNTGSGHRAYGYGAAVDTSGNFYFAGQYSTSSTSPRNYATFISKYSSTGTLLSDWTFAPTNPSTSNSILEYSLQVDSSGNVYLANSGDPSVLYKFSSAGSLQWARSITGSSFGLNTAVNSSGDVYAAYWNGFSSTRITKINSSGTVQWSRDFGVRWQNSNVGVQLDSLGNVYVCAQIDSTYLGLVVKFDSSGNVLWQRTIAGPFNNFVSLTGICIDADDNNFVVGGYYDATGGFNYAFFAARLPTDGSKTGAYSGFTYAASSLTITSVSASTATPTFVSLGLTPPVGFPSTTTFDSGGTYLKTVV